MATDYFLGQGKVYIAKRDANGNVLAQRWLGDVSAAKLTLKVNKSEHKESYSGQRALAKSIVVGKESSVDLTVMELSKENLALSLFGKTISTAQGSVSGETLPTGLVAGDRVTLAFPKVSAVTLTDSSATPATITPAKYQIDPDFGAITLLDVAGITQPIKAAYTHAAVESVPMFTAPQPEVFIRYEGVNLAEDNAPFIVELYKVNTEPLKDLALITDKIADVNINCSVLIDRTKSADGDLGQFGRIIKVTT